MIVSFMVLVNEIGEPIRMVDVDDKIGFCLKGMYFGLEYISKKVISLSVNSFIDDDDFLNLFYKYEP